MSTHHPPGSKSRYQPRTFAALAMCVMLFVTLLVPSASAQPTKKDTAELPTQPLPGSPRAPDDPIDLTDGNAGSGSCGISGSTTANINDTIAFQPTGDDCGDWLQFSWWSDGASPGGASDVISFETKWATPGDKVVHAAKYGMALSLSVTVVDPNAADDCQIAGPANVETGQEVSYSLTGDDCGPWENFTWTSSSDDTEVTDTGIRTRWDSQGNPTVRANGNGFSLEKSVIVTVAAPKASIVASQQAPFQPGWQVTFHNEHANGGQTHRWDINGQVSEGVSAAYTIPSDVQIASVVVRLTVTGADGQTDTDVDTFDIASQPVQADIASTPDTGTFEAGDSVRFYNRRHSIYIDAYEWKINGVVVSTTNEANYTVRGDEGELDVELTVTGYQGTGNGPTSAHQNKTATSLTTTDWDRDRETYVVTGTSLEPGIAIQAENVFLGETAVFSVQHLGTVDDGGSYHWSTNGNYDFDTSQGTKTIEVELDEIGYLEIEVDYIHRSCNPDYQCSATSENLVAPQICIGPRHGELDPIYGTTYVLTNTCLADPFDDDDDDWDDIQWRWIVDDTVTQHTNPEVLILNLDALGTRTVVLQASHDDVEPILTGAPYEVVVEPLDASTAENRSYQCTIGTGAQVAVQEQLDALNLWLANQNAPPIAHFIPRVAPIVEMGIPYSTGVWIEGFIPSTDVEGSEYILPPTLGSHFGLGVTPELTQESWYYKGFLNGHGLPQMTSRWAGSLEYATFVDFTGSASLTIPAELEIGPIDLKLNFHASGTVNYRLDISYNSGRQTCINSDWVETDGSNGFIDAIGIGGIGGGGGGGIEPPDGDITPIDPGASGITPIDPGAHDESAAATSRKVAAKSPR